MYIKDSHLKHLSKIDKVQKRLIEKYDKPQLSKSEDYILDLCKYIIFQQISTKAGNSIYQRFIDFYNLNKNNIILINFLNLLPCVPACFANIQIFHIFSIIFNINNLIIIWSSCTICIWASNMRVSNSS